MSTVVTSLQVLTNLPAVTQLGTSAFLAANADELIIAISLIGNNSNYKFLSFVRKQTYSLQSNFLGSEYLPQFKSGKQAIEIKEGTQDQKDCRFFIITSIYVLLQKYLQLLIMYAVLFAIMGLLFAVNNYITF